MTDTRHPTQCEGACVEHRGPVRKVLVNQGSTSNEHVRDWDFYYCDEAIDTDRKCGFSVTEAQP